MNTEMLSTGTAWAETGDLHALMRRAARIRDTHWGRTVTYSRKAFVPLTNMCRDTCGYCTFVKHPDSPEANIMTPEQVLATARKGEREGCKELLLNFVPGPDVVQYAALLLLDFSVSDFEAAVGVFDMVIDDPGNVLQSHHVRGQAGRGAGQCVMVWRPVVCAAQVGRHWDTMALSAPLRDWPGALGATARLPWHACRHSERRVDCMGSTGRPAGDGP